MGNDCSCSMKVESNKDSQMEFNTDSQTEPVGVADKTLLQQMTPDAGTDAEKGARLVENPQELGGFAKLAPIVFNAEAHNATLILLHGYSMDATSIAALGEAFSRAMPWLKVMLPFTQMRDTMKMGENAKQVPCWAKMVPGGIDIDGLNTTGKFLCELFDAEVAAGISRKRIVVGGFSQGAMASAWTGLQQQEPLAGVFMLSGGIWPVRDQFVPSQGSLSETSVWMCHGGEADTFVKLENQRMLRDLLKEKGYKDVQLHEIEGMSHSIKGLDEWARNAGHPAANSAMQGVDEEVEQAIAWLTRVVPNDDAQ